MITKKQLAQYAYYERKNKNSILRQRFFAKDPHCHWCHIEVFLYPEIANRNLRKNEAYPNDMATVDHLYDRFSPEERYKIYKNGENKVLACNKCNQSRNTRRIRQFSEQYHNRRREIMQERRIKKDRTPRIFILQSDPKLKNSS
jgi:hypothetical protein